MHVHTRYIKALIIIHSITTTYGNIIHKIHIITPNHRVHRFNQFLPLKAVDILAHKHIGL